MPLLYKITSPTGRIYIGQTWNLENRLKHYVNADCIKQPKLYASLRKHGWNAHFFEIIEKLPEDVNQATIDDFEIFTISQLKEAGFSLLNIREGGSRGKHSQESIAKIGNGHRGKKVSAEAIQKRLQTLEKTGALKWSEERKRTQKYWQGKKIPAEIIAKRHATRIANGGYKQAPEAIAKMVEKRVASGSYKRTPEQIRKGLETRQKTGYRHSEETKAKMRKPKKAQNGLAERTANYERARKVLNF